MAVDRFMPTRASPSGAVSVSSGVELGPIVFHSCAQSFRMPLQRMAARMSYVYDPGPPVPEWSARHLGPVISAGSSQAE